MIHALACTYIVPLHHEPACDLRARARLAASASTNCHGYSNGLVVEHLSALRLSSVFVRENIRLS